MEHVHIPSAALVLVSDGRQAKFLRNRGTPVAPQLILEHSLERKAARTSELGTDRPGRSHSPDGRSRSAMAETDLHQQEETRFAAEVAEVLLEMEHARKFRELVVVAPPRMLGDLRAHFHREVTDCVVAEVPKDFTATPVPELGKLLS